jgi:hypothetical protein
MGLMIEAFSLLAVGTSLIGTLLGASQFFVEQTINLFPPLREPFQGAVSNPFHNAHMLLYNNFTSVFIPDGHHMVP